MYTQHTETQTQTHTHTHTHKNTQTYKHTHTGDNYECTVRTNKNQIPCVTLEIKPTLQPKKDHPKMGRIDDLP